MDISLKELAKNAVHFGHKTSRWNPKIKPYLYGKNKEVHIFDLHQTASKLKEALEYLHDATSKGKTVLFVATKPQAGVLIKELCEELKLPYVSEKWLCGLLTNFETIKTRIKRMKKLKEMKQTGEIEKYTKKEQGQFMKEYDKLHTMLGGVEDLTKAPDILFIIDTLREHNCVKEAKKLGITTIGIVDSNADPTTVDFPIPANDDAVKSITCILGLAKQAIVSKPAKAPAPKKKEEPKAEKKEDKKA